mmetsp:Transcript_11444/g.26277  ORF Transcript_11444/g.26277 Transcript_11444/m.26277 type:complete len:92 (-) Transcript_11444:238-513(-)|eukprot:CAMPEP_0181216346 /NCGR_PEP_ID=MMETSP1096-20121128/26532_1 /TAXON_ID=156174 ORGANISM="Chrysochromulina ericina, Strain CCMP281" /NCGR_SAMPLE_ID=MMETSP1096 /ASSEMBLY_ACC=CAM_ASM_000453 /LENGTH=91 /DNA_ID=CAMNT_0023308331 /DNA_START=87 /DNA_END=362 /DNA_ORIENTATION=+
MAESLTPDTAIELHTHQTDPDGYSTADTASPQHTLLRNQSVDCTRSRKQLKLDFDPAFNSEAAVHGGNLFFDSGIRRHIAERNARLGVAPK